MAITRIESLVYGVTNIAEAADFYQDAGLDPVVIRPDYAEFATLENQTIVLKRLDDPSLPPALDEGSTLRELIWGVASADDLVWIKDELQRDRAVTSDDQGVLHSRDEGGLAIGFAITRQILAPDPVPQPANALRKVERWNTPLTKPGHPKPLRIAHLAYNIVEANHQAQIDFYLKRLRFKATDAILDTGTFMQCEGDAEHHNFFLCFRPDKAGINHFALELRNFDEVIAAGNYMIEQHWKESRTLGRHLLGSNLYRFYHAPSGGRLEFICDMDRMDKSFETRVWEKNPGHHLWSLKASGGVSE